MRGDKAAILQTNAISGDQDIHDEHAGRGRYDSNS